MERTTNRARELRQRQTPSEGLLWSLLRAKQLCGLKFRRQHPVGPYYADFACETQRLIVEIDGGYHDAVIDSDLNREAILKQQGWRILRFTDKEVEANAEAVARAIAAELGLDYTFTPRSGSGAGMESVRSPQKRADDT